MSQDLQDIVDALAIELQRGVAIDDNQLRLLAHSAHALSVDPLRQQSIITRRAEGRVLDWVIEHGAAESNVAVRMEANPDISAAARVCSPIRCRGLLLGFLFVLDDDRSMTDEEVRRCDHAASEAGELLYEQRFLRQRERQREGDLLRVLFDAETAVHAGAASTLVEEGFLASQAGVVVVAVGLEEAVDGPAMDRLGLCFAAILEAVRRALPAHSIVGAVSAREVVLVAGAAALERTGMTLFERWLRDLGDRELAVVGAHCVVGCGAPVDVLSDALRSHEQAHWCLPIARCIPRFDRAVAWERAGPYRALVHIPLHHAAEACDPALLRLLDHEDLVKTLETYLDRAGDAKATAEALILHRASLYYRLQKIEQITGMNLKSGEDRLALHLGLKLRAIAKLGNEH
ncbi:MAG: helix-turn-helix domain-containing protein [Vicinamibacterales bacterium]